MRGAEGTYKKVLHEFQKETVEFLLANKHAILADAPGVGKTDPTCVALRRLRLNPTALIIAPPSVKDTWRYRLTEWGFKRNAIKIFETRKDRNDSCSISIVNRSLLYDRALLEHLLSFNYDAVIVDEAHEFKSMEGSGTQLLFGTDHPLIARGRYRWLLSGSMMPNRPLELLPALQALFPEVIAPYGTYAAYTKQFCGGYYDGEGWNANGSSNIPDLRGRLQGKLLRRELTEVYDSIPDVIEKDVFITVDMEESERDTVLATLEKLVGIAKLEKGIRYIEDWLSNSAGKKLVVFTHHREVTEKIHERFKLRAVKYYGGMSARDKALSLKNFCDDGEVDLFVVNMRSGGVALDGLQYVCNHALYFQINWDEPSQSAGRLVRNGQTEPVYLTRLIAEGTIEEAAIFKQRQKQTIQKILYEKEPKKESPMTEQKIPDTIVDAVARVLNAFADKLEMEAHVLTTGGSVTTISAPKSQSQPRPGRASTTIQPATASPAGEAAAQTAPSKETSAPKKEEGSKPQTPVSEPDVKDHDRAKKTAAKLLNFHIEGLTGTEEEKMKQRSEHPLTVANKAMIRQVVVKYCPSGVLKDLPKEHWKTCADELEKLERITELPDESPPDDV